MNQEIRNKLRNVVTQCRTLLERDIREVLEGKYVIFERKGNVTADRNAKIDHLIEDEPAARNDILDHFGHIQARGFKPKEALDQLVREIAFTHLNRLCAYKMMEAREVYLGDQKFREAVTRGFHSNGVKFYLADHPEEERLFNTGHQDIAYRHFLNWLGGLLSDEIGVLFDPNDSANRLYPRQKTLDEVLELLNRGGIKPEETNLLGEWPKIWSQDETIGWVYQYFTPKELRDQARKDSPAPRNSYELAFRNQFFTPRYVVEFLTDNTLGRIWYEMRKGETKLKDQCRYLARRPTEVFLDEGGLPPTDARAQRDDLAQEELRRLPVYVPHRQKKDPRDLRILDPASGSGHFLLYCFDLLLTIYEEAYSDPELGPALQEEYLTLNELRRELPRLILAHNLHGIDIDLRCAQIAALALWLRCQRAYQEMGLKKDRPAIRRSNFVCAEPMPGEEQMLKEFVSQLEPTFLGQVVEVVFERMKLAGEAGFLLKIEEEIREAVATARKQWIAETTRAMDRKGQPLLFTQMELDRIGGKPGQPSLFDLSDITNEQFFEKAEAEVIKALRQYAEHAKNGHRFQRKLFADDAERGFAFVDLCQKRYDVVLMNPPFGAPTDRMASVLYADAASNLYPAFVLRACELSISFVAAITDRTFFVQDSFKRFRAKLLSPHWSLRVAIDLGWGVLDTADVQVATYVLSNQGDLNHWFLDLREFADKSEALVNSYDNISAAGFRVLTEDHFRHIPNRVFAYSLPQIVIDMFVRDQTLAKIASLPRGLGSNNAFRTYRAWFEVPQNSLGANRRWRSLSNGGDFSPFFREDAGVADWTREDGKLLVSEGYADGFKAYDQRKTDHYFEAGLSFPKQSSVFNVSALSADAIPTREGKAIIPCKGEEIWFLLAYLNSSLVRRIVEATSGLHKQSGSIGLLPVPDLPREVRSAMGVAAKTFAESQLWNLYFDETSRFFQGPKCLFQKTPDALVYESPYTAIDNFLFNGLGIDGESRETIRCIPPKVPRLFTPSSDDLISFAVGCCFNRWSYKLRTLQSYRPLDPIPDEPPAMRNPAEEGTLATDGILVDDSESLRDIVTCTHNAVERLTSSHQADAVIVEECRRLGVSNLREYFRTPSSGGFWQSHLGRYNKSRRKAPIYWLLQSSKRNYALWLYYHRFDRDFLFKALVNYVEPKIRLESSQMEALLRQKAEAGTSGGKAKQIAKKLEEQDDFLSELRDFEDKLRRVANLHLDPDVNDGVVLNIAPLHELVPWKEAEEYWEELLKGEYDWSSIGKQLRQKGLVK